ncbi:MAG: FAD-binding protein, partial [Acidobacteria bacterium]|nr:FAD-binding protein [Acidobacteriota bacterium]
LTAEGNIIPGLYAVGEVAGLGGVNGKAGLEGTFLGPSLIQGRRAGRFITHRQDPAAPPAPKLEPVAENQAGDAVCRTCHTLPMRFFGARSGYRHFRRAHQLAEERKFTCRQCHGEVQLARPWLHHINDASQTASCSNCHLPWTGPAPATR